MVMVLWIFHDFSIYVETESPGIQRPAKGLALVYWPSGQKRRRAVVLGVFWWKNMGVSTIHDDSCC